MKPSSAPSATLVLVIAPLLFLSPIFPWLNPKDRVVVVLVDLPPRPAAAGASSVLWKQDRLGCNSGSLLISYYSRKYISQFTWKFT